MASTTSSFGFSTVNERSILRLLKFIACDNGKIGNYAKLVDDRNETVHPNGQILYSTQAALDTRIAEVLRVVAEIQAHSTPIIADCFRAFLRQNHDPGEREYAADAGQIREVLIHANYLSWKDVEIRLGFNINAIAGEAGFSAAKALSDAFVQAYKKQFDG